MQELTWEEIDKVMEKLQEDGIGISREAVVTLADTGICTEERPVSDYIAAKKYIEEVSGRRI